MTPEETIAVVKRANDAGFPSVAEYAVHLERALRLASRQDEVLDRFYRWLALDEVGRLRKLKEKRA